MNAPDPRLPDSRYLSRMDRAELGRWVRRLRFFRFCRAYGGHANDGDQLLAALRYASDRDLSELLMQLNLPVVKLVDFTCGSPGRVTLAGQAVYVGVRTVPARQLEFSIVDPDNPYEVTPRAVAAAEAVETLLTAHEARRVDPPQPTHCYHPAQFPDLWAAE